MSDDATRTEQSILYYTLGVLVLFMTCLFIASKSYAVDVPECIEYDSSYAESGIKQLDEEGLLYQVFINAQMWAFDPGEMYFPVGSEVDFYLTSRDVVHGFHIVDYDVNLMAVPGAVNKTTVIFDKPGVYHLVCHEYCGTGHQNMAAEIIVNYPTK